MDLLELQLTVASELRAITPTRDEMQNGLPKKHAELFAALTDLEDDGLPSDRVLLELLAQHHRRFRAETRGQLGRLQMLVEDLERKVERLRAERRNTP